MLDDEIMPGMKKDEDTQNYILRFKIPKDISIEGFDGVDKAVEFLSEYFLNSSDKKKTMYVPSCYNVDEYGCGYIDVFYPVKYKKNKSETKYISDDG